MISWFWLQFKQIHISQSSMSAQRLIDLLPQGGWSQAIGWAGPSGSLPLFSPSSPGLPVESDTFFVLALALTRSFCMQIQLSNSRKTAGVFCRVYFLLVSDLSRLMETTEPAQGKQQEKRRIRWKGDLDLLLAAAMASWISAVHHFNTMSITTLAILTTLKVCLQTQRTSLEVLFISLSCKQPLFASLWTNAAEGQITL